jgi:hypothetical protein
MSPDYESRAEKALRMLKEIRGDDLISAQAKIDYQECHRLLLKTQGDYNLAMILWNQDEAKRTYNSR